jgi:hypothetical protein
MSRQAALLWNLELSDLVRVWLPATIVSSVVPVNSVLPVISWASEPGILRCSHGIWSPTPTAYAYIWTRDGYPIAGIMNQTYIVQPEDAGCSVSCQVEAFHGVSSDAAMATNSIGIPLDGA